MAPKSVAVLGASPKHKARGNTAVLNLRNFGFVGDIYPIHPTADEVGGLRCYATLAELPVAPECVVVALSADKAVSALEEAAQAGVKAAVVYASGFAEGGPEGQALQERLVALSRATGLRVCGPNSLGLCNVVDRVSMYGAVLPENLATSGLAILSQSGSACIALSNLGRFGLSYVVSVGNGAVVDVDAYLDYVVEDPATTAAALFIESVRDPEAFASAARRMNDAGKTVVALKVGRSAKGAAVTAAHTGSLAGPQAVYADFFRRCGVIAVDDLDEMTESLALAMTLRRKTKGRGVAIVNVSGGESALNCDLAELAGVLLPELEQSTVDRLQAVMPEFAKVSNPLDATGTAVFDMQLYSECVRSLALDPGVALVAVSQDSPAGMGGYQANNYRNIAEHVAAVAREVSTPIVYYSNVAGGVHPLVSAPLLAADVPVLQGIRPALLAIQRHLERSVAASRAPSIPPALPSLPQDARWRQRLSAGTALNEKETKEFLADYGVAVTRETIAPTVDEAVAAASDLGYPVVLKISAPAIQHKTEAGGVALDLRDEAAVRAAFERIMASAKAYAPDAPIDGVLVQEMVSGGTEVIVGLSRCRPFGHSIVVGAGGVLVELVADSALSLVPIDRTEAAALIARTRVARLLAGYRGGPAADVDALVNALCAVSDLAVRFGDVIETLEMNPVTVLARGRGVRVLDALLIHNPNSQ